MNSAIFKDLVNFISKSGEALSNLTTEEVELFDQLRKCLKHYNNECKYIGSYPNAQTINAALHKQDLREISTKINNMELAFYVLDKNSHRSGKYVSVMYNQTEINKLLEL